MDLAHAGVGSQLYRHLGFTENTFQDLRVGDAASPRSPEQVADLASRIARIRLSPKEQQHETLRELHGVLRGGDYSSIARVLKYRGMHDERDFYGFPLTKFSDLVFHSIDNIVEAVANKPEDSDARILLRGELRSAFLIPATLQAIGQLSGLYPGADQTQRLRTLELLNQGTHPETILGTLVRGCPESLTLVPADEESRAYSYRCGRVVPLRFLAPICPRNQNRGLMIRSDILGTGVKLPVTITYLDSGDVKRTSKHEDAHAQFYVYRGSDRPDAIETHLLDEIHSRLAEDVPIGREDVTSFMAEYTKNYFDTLDDFIKADCVPSAVKRYAQRLIDDALLGGDSLLEHIGVIANLVGERSDSERNRGILRNLCLYSENLDSLKSKILIMSGLGLWE